MAILIIIDTHIKRVIFLNGSELKSIYVWKQAYIFFYDIFDSDFWRHALE